MFIRGLRNRVYYRSMDTGGNWSAWKTLPVKAKATLGVCEFNSRLYLVRKVSGRYMYCSSMDTGENWSAWQQIHHKVKGGPAVAVFDP